MEDNKKETGIPDITFKKEQEDLSSTLQLKVVDAISKAKQHKEDKLVEQIANVNKEEHFVIDLDNTSQQKKAEPEKVKSVDLLNGGRKEPGNAPSGKAFDASRNTARPAANANRSSAPKKANGDGRQGTSAGSMGQSARAKSGSVPKRNVSNSIPTAEQKRRELTNKVKEANSSQGAAAVPKKKKWTKRKKILVIGGIIFLCLFILFLVAYGFFHKWHGLLKTDDGKVDSNYQVKIDTSSSNTIDKQAEEDRIKAELEKNAQSIMSEDGVQNILLIGEDIRDTALEERGNTDVMMLISINDNAKKIVMTSFLRDTYTEIPGWNASKLNAAYGYGGVELLSATLQQDYAINIDRYVIVNFYSFIEIVEAVGGLDFDVSYTEAVAMRDPLNEQNHYLGYDDGSGYVDFDQYGKDGTDLYTDYEADKLRTYIEYNSEQDNSKKLHLDGNQSLAYARIRYGCGDDYGRTSRQREAIAEMIKKAKKLSFSELDKLAEKVASQVKTDITENEVAGLILGAFTYMGYDIEQQQIPATDTFSNQIIDGLDCLSVDFTANAQILQEKIYGKTNIDGQQSHGQYADEDGDGVNDYYVDNNGDGVDDNLLDLDGDGVDDRKWSANANNTNNEQPQ